MPNQRLNAMLKAGIVLSSSGVLLATSCSATGLDAIVSGIEAAAQVLDSSNTDNNISFGDWLLMELND